MSDLLWPGDERAGEVMTDAAWLAAMVAVEQSWLDGLVHAGIAPESTRLADLVGPDDIDALAVGAESSGNPVPGLVALLRARAAGPAGPWIHRGLTSQDVVDTGLVLCLRDAADRVRPQLRLQVRTLVTLAETHRGTLMAGRTLTQAAVPITFGLKAAAWLSGVLDAADRLTGLGYPAQFGGAAGTLAATAELASTPGRPGEAALRLTTAAAQRLGLVVRPPWHTNRSALTAVGDALAACTDAWGKIAADTLTLSRPEIAELGEAAGAPAHGGSSTMPHKHNPVLSTLIRRAAISAPLLAATLHLAAALSEDERSAGPWHAEWPALQALGRRTVVAGSQTTDLLAGLNVEADRMSGNARAAWAQLTSEQASIAVFAGHPPAGDDYLGAADAIIEATLTRARTWAEAQT